MRVFLGFRFSKFLLSIGTTLLRHFLYTLAALPAQNQSDSIHKVNAKAGKQTSHHSETSEGTTFYSCLEVPLQSYMTYVETRYYVGWFHFELKSLLWLHSGPGNIFSDEQVGDSPPFSAPHLLWLLLQSHFGALHAVITTLMHCVNCINQCSSRYLGGPAVQWL